MFLLLCCDTGTCPADSVRDVSQSLACLQGWIPRSGLQYGTDLVLYEQHPSLVHSTVCVLIVVTPFAGEDCRPPAVCNSGARMDGQDGTLSWHDVEGINRLCVRVNSVSPILAVPGCCRNSIISQDES